MKFLLLVALVGVCVAAVPHHRRHPHRHHKNLNNDDKVIGGEIAEPGQFPWMVALREVTDGPLFHTCGGSILSETWILTAAQCCSAQPRFIHVVAGDHERTGDEEASEQHVAASATFVHEEFNEFTFANDICLIQLETPLMFNENVSAVVLPGATQDLDGMTLTLSGWGSINEGGVLATYLNFVNLPTLTDAECLGIYGGAPPTFDYNVCTGDVVNGGIDACAGDAGGPLVLEGTNTQAAIVSWGAGCARPGYPGVQLEVAPFLEWINMHTGLPL